MNETHASASALIVLAMKTVTEGEPFDLSDQDLTLEEIVALRSHLASMRTAIDQINKGLAIYWANRYPHETLETETKVWSLSRPKGKRAVSEDQLYMWLSTLSYDRLKKLVPVHSLRVSGMTEGERETFLDETPITKDVGISARPL
jgi:hypothetical protein